MKTRTYLAIDFGTVRIGLASSYGPIAEPLEVLRVADFRSENHEKSGKISNMLHHYLAKLIKDNQYKAVIIGLSEGAMAVKTKQFADELRAAIDVPVHFYDETLTSQQSKQKLRQAKKSSPRRQEVDHYAAAEILQGWLDENY